ncbi:MAG: AmmeMemoRadiSam system protein A [Candidatus Hydrogenedentes bacterium]|nr:AmmeMemoRadiSam system protein A [Candidatus Hydrogenedentota bacterium]
MEAFLSSDEESLLLRIARDSLKAYLRDEVRIDLGGYPLTPPLRERHGAFVTLRLGGALRGCIGHTRGIESLAEAVRDNAINAAVRDPRFPPLTPEELGHTHIEISALRPGAAPDTPFIPVGDIREIVVGRDGLYLDHAGSRGGGLLLPQVATERGWGLDQFLEALCTKAGAEPGAWKAPGCELFRFSAQVFGESPEGA